MTREQIRTYLTDNILNNVVAFVMDDRMCDMLTAMKYVYSSPVMKWLQDKEDDLYIQSPAYIYELMKKVENS